MELRKYYKRPLYPPYGYELVASNTELTGAALTVSPDPDLWDGEAWDDTPTDEDM